MHPLVDLLSQTRTLTLVHVKWQVRVFLLDIQPRLLIYTSSRSPKVTLHGQFNSLFLFLRNTHHKNAACYHIKYVDTIILLFIKCINTTQRMAKH